MSTLLDSPVTVSGVLVRNHQTYLLCLEKGVPIGGEEHSLWIVDPEGDPVKAIEHIGALRDLIGCELHTTDYRKLVSVGDRQIGKFFFMDRCIQVSSWEWVKWAAQEWKAKHQEGVRL